jgi:hypothetical protein
MILCVSIGGVYAAWTYTNSAKDIADVYEAYTITLTTATEEGAHGVYSIDTNITKFTIEQNGTAVPEDDFHKAVLNVVTSDGQPAYIKIKLDLAPNAPKDEVVFAAFDTTYDIKVVDVNSQYAGSDIFYDKHVGTTTIADSAWELVDAENRIFSYTINLDAEIALNNFILKSKQEHTNFGNALGNPLLRIDVSDGTVAGG